MINYTYDKMMGAVTYSLMGDIADEPLEHVRLKVLTMEIALRTSVNTQLLTLWRKFNIA